LETSASGLPVINTYHGGIRDVVKDDETGYLVAEDDTDGMSRHMINLIRSPDLAAALGQTARAHVRANFSMEKSIATLTDIIEHSRHKQRNRLTVSNEGHL
jgi:colanic acid/amylovoran biosynthesis glycosyltransferase